MPKPPLGWRTKEKLLREFHQGGIADRWSERRLLILLAEYRMHCRNELLQELKKGGRLRPAEEDMKSWTDSSTT